MDKKVHTVNFEFPDGAVVRINNITTGIMIKTIEYGVKRGYFDLSIVLPAFGIEMIEYYDKMNKDVLEV
jgi:hypothetical protein